MFKKFITSLALAAFLSGTPVQAQQPLQWRYSFDANGVATATYPGNVVSNGTTTLDSVVVEPTIDWSGPAVAGTDKSAIWVNEQLDGSSTAPAGSYLWTNQVNVTTNMDMGDSTTNMDVLRVQGVIDSGSVGTVNAIHGRTVVLNSPSDTAIGGSFPAYVGGFFTSYSDKPLGGSGTTYGTSAGGLWGINPNVTIAAGATNIYGIVSGEFDVTAQAGSSIAQKIGISIVQDSASAVQGSQDDIAINVINKSGAVGWKRGLEFGNTAAYWPMGAGSYIIYAEKGSSASATAARGIDFSNVTFAEAAMRFQGIVFDAKGRINTTATVPTPNVPTVGTCGGGTPTVTGSDMSGTVTVGTGSPTACTVTFSGAWAAAPHCVLTPRGAIATPMYISAESTTLFTATFPSGLASFNYICMQ